jgi:hypothetical protein
MKPWFESNRETAGLWMVAAGVIGFFGAVGLVAMRPVPTQWIAATAAYFPLGAGVAGLTYYGCRLLGLKDSKTHKVIGAFRGHGEVKGDFEEDEAVAERDPANDAEGRSMRQIEKALPADNSIDAARRRRPRTDPGRGAP